MEIRKAVRQQKKLRLALIGPTGAGKTLTALELAVGMARGGRILVVDTEHGRASLYGDRFDFDVIELDNYDPKNYIEAMQLAAREGYAVVVLDSMSHAWAGTGGVLQKVTQASGNKFTDGWGAIGTPTQNKFIEAILTAPFHVIGTMRAKMDYIIEQDDRGRAVPRKLGLAPVQRNDVEYEFDIIGRMDLNHVLTIDKSYDARLPIGETVSKPDRNLALKLIAWLETGEQAPAKVEQPATPQIHYENVETGETHPEPPSNGHTQPAQQPTKNITYNDFWTLARTKKGVDAKAIVKVYTDVNGKIDWVNAYIELESK